MALSTGMLLMDELNVWQPTGRGGQGEKGRGQGMYRGIHELHIGYFNSNRESFLLL